MSFGVTDPWLSALGSSVYISQVPQFVLFGHSGAAGGCLRHSHISLATGLGFGEIPTGLEVCVWENGFAEEYCFEEGNKNIKCMSVFETQSLAVSVWKARVARVKHPRTSGCKNSQVSTDSRGNQADRWEARYWNTQEVTDREGEEISQVDGVW